MAGEAVAQALVLWLFLLTAPLGSITFLACCGFPHVVVAFRLNVQL